MIFCSFNESRNNVDFHCHDYFLTINSNSIYNIRICDKSFLILSLILTDIKGKERKIIDSMLSSLANYLLGGNISTTQNSRNASNSESLENFPVVARLSQVEVEGDDWILIDRTSRFYRTSLYLVDIRRKKEKEM